MSAIEAITVPKWGLTMTEGTVSQWLVEEGTDIQVGDEILDMETSKITNTVESIVAGKLRRIVAQPGDTLEPAFESLPMNGMRRTIAARLQTSKQTSPHFRVSIDVELDSLLALRKQINEDNPGVKVSVNDFMIKACAMALIKVPDVNVQFDAIIHPPQGIDAFIKTVHGEISQADFID